MRTRHTVVGLLLATIALAAAPAVAGAHPSAGELYVGWAEKVGMERGVQCMQGSSARRRRRRSAGQLEHDPGRQRR